MAGSDKNTSELGLSHLALGFHHCCLCLRTNSPYRDCCDKGEVMRVSKRSCVFFNEDFYWFHTQAVGMIAVGDPLAEPEYLAPDVDDAMLGVTLRQCLQKSRHIEMSEFQEMFKAGVFNQLDERRNQAVMQKYGYKTKRALYKNMRCCWISMFDGKVEIAPSHQKSVDSYTATKDGPEPLTLHGPIGDAELGSALREGFKRCTVQ